MRRVLAGRVTLRRVPEVVFQYDEGLAAHQRVEEILHELHEQEAARAEARPPPTPTRRRAAIAAAPARCR